MAMHQNQFSRGPKIRFQPSGKSLLSRAGLHSFLQMLEDSGLGQELANCFPEDGSNRSSGNYNLGLLLLCSLLSGHDSIDDIEEFDDDEVIEKLFGGKIPTAKTMGNFLRRFEKSHIDSLKRFLTTMGFSLRDHVRSVHPHKGDELPHFKIDGTSHEQHGRKMEGCGWMKTSSDKTVYGYASQTVFDEIGFCYNGELLPAKHPRGNASRLLDQVLTPLRGKKINNPFEKVAHISGDSAYLTESVVTTIMTHHSTFTISAPRTINWHNHIDGATWTEWEYGLEDEKKYRRKKKSPPECYLSRWHWSPGWSKETLKFPVIIKKEWRDDEVFGQQCGSFHYHAVATNRGLDQRSYQSVIEEYRPRADVENMIKEFKLGFDAKHLPCLKMSANEVYFLFVLIAQNLIRWAAVVEQPDKPHFSKKIRRKLINSPGILLTGSRQLVLQVRTKFFKEVTRFLEAWKSQPVRIFSYNSTA